MTQVAAPAPMPLSALFAPAAPPPASSGGRLVAADGRELPLRGAQLHVRARGGVAVITLTQRFANPHAEPLSVRYTMPLPADAAVSGYAFRLGKRLVRGEVDRKASARDRFERAIVEGKTAALLDQERSSVFTQELGNLPPGEELEAILELDQRLVWLADGLWEWRFPTVVAPRYAGEPGRVADAARLAVDVADGPLSPRMELALHVLDALPFGAAPSSPTHAITVEQGEGQQVRLARGARLDRDLAVRWSVAQQAVGVSLQVARPEASRPVGKSSAFGLLTVVPPSPAATPRAVPRDLILLVDASGSMHGAPMAQARQIMLSMIDALGDDDRLELISFGDRPHRWQQGAVRATEGEKRQARGWVKRLQAEGGTEMRAGILEALRPLRAGAQRQVVLITDGLIGFEDEIVATLLERLPRGCRLHTVGVGAAVNRTLTGPAARAGRGVEVILDLDEPADAAARRLLERTHAPLVTELQIEGDALLEHAPAALPDLFAGAPALLSLRLRPGGGKLRLRGETPQGAWATEIDVPATEPGQGPTSLAALFGRERVEDLEARWAAGADQQAIDRQIEQTGLTYQISTRLTSWVAVTEETTVDPGAPKRREVVPQEIPHGMSLDVAGLRAPSFSGGMAAPAMDMAGGGMPVAGGGRTLAMESEDSVPMASYAVMPGAPVMAPAPRPQGQALPSSRGHELRSLPARRRSLLGPGLLVLVLLAVVAALVWWLGR